MTVPRRSIREYLATQRGRYERASRAERQTLLDEIVAMTGYHCKALIRHLRRRRPAPLRARPMGTR